MFTGAAGFELAISAAAPDWRCVGHCENDKWASAVLKYRYPDIRNYGDARRIISSGLPDFNFLVGGFPCQPFSIAGKGRGFEDTRGTLFFEIARILQVKKPRGFLLENVKRLLSHDDYRTITEIVRVLTDLGYSVAWQVLNSKYFGVPQNRERIFILGTRDRSSEKVFPISENNPGFNEIQDEQTQVTRSLTAGGNSMGLHSQMTILRWQNVDAGMVKDDIAATIRAHAANDGYRKENFVISDSGLGRKKEVRATVAPLRANRSTGYSDMIVEAIRTTNTRSNQEVIGYTRDKNGKRHEHTKELFGTVKSVTGSNSNQADLVLDDMEVRRLTPVECERLQGFPDDWTKTGDFSGKVKHLKDSQRYKMMGNAVTTTVVAAIIKKYNQIIGG